VASLVLLSAGLIFSYFLYGNYALQKEMAIEYEGPCLWAASRIFHGQNPYPLESLSESPFAVIIYPPLYFLATAPLMFFSEGYRLSRLFSLLTALGSALFYYLFLRRLKLSKLSAMTSSALFMSFMAVWLWAAKARVDELSLCLTLISLYFFAGWKRKSNLIFSAVTLSLATMTKQPSALFAPSYCLFLLLQKNWKGLAIMAGTFTLSLAAQIGICQLATAGGFIAHMRFASHMPFQWQYLVDRLTLMLGDLPKFAMAFFSLSFLAPLISKQDKEKSTSLVLAALLLITSLPVTLYTAGTEYSNVNHFLIALIPLPLFIALALDWSIKSPSLGGKLYKIATACTNVISALILSFLAYSQFNPAKLSDKPHLDKPISLETFRGLVTGKSILAEDGGYGVLFGAESEPVDITTFIQVLGRDGKQAEQMTEKLNHCQYAAVVMNHKELDGTRNAMQWSAKLKAALQENYRFAGQINGNGECQDVFLPARSMR